MSTRPVRTTAAWRVFPIPVWVFLAVKRCATVWIRNCTTLFGRYAGHCSNEQVARYAAVDADPQLPTCVLLGVCVSIATLLYVPRLGSASPTTGLL